MRLPERTSATELEGLISIDQTFVSRAEFRRNHVKTLMIRVI